MNGSPLEFQVRRPPLWSPRFMLSMSGILLVGWMIARGLPALWMKLLAFGAVGGLLLVAFVAKVISYRNPPAPIRVYDDTLELPRSLGSSRVRRVHVRDLQSLELRGSGDRPWLIIAAKGRTLVVPGFALERPEELGNLHAALFERISHLPAGDQVLETMRLGREATRALIELRPRVTHFLLASIAVAYAIEVMALQAAGGSDPGGLFTLLELGGNQELLVRAGQIDRLITANWLHAPPGGGPGLLHIGLNSLALWMLGGLMERLLGHWRFFVVYFVSAIGGTVASAFGGQQLLPSVGASTAILGLFGALAVVHLFHLRSIPPAVRQPARWWIFIIGINLMISLAVPSIDDWGHGGGLVAGALTTILLTIRWRPLERARNKDRLLRPVVWAMAGVCAVGLGVSGWRYLQRGPESYAPVLQGLVEREDAEPQELNNFAFMVASSEDSSRGMLETALAAAERAHELEPDAMYIVDTVAQVEWRLGNVDRAIELERRALTGATDGAPFRGTYATQLARFLERRVNDQGPILIGDDVPELSFEVRRGKLHTTMRGDPPATGLVAYVVVERGDPLPWLARVRIGPDVTPPAEYVLNERWPNRMTAHVALVDTTVEVPRGIDFRVDEYEPEDSIADLP